MQNNNNTTANKPKAKQNKKLREQNNPRSGPQNVEHQLETKNGELSERGRKQSFLVASAPYLGRRQAGLNASTFFVVERYTISSLPDNNQTALLKHE